MGCFAEQVKSLPPVKSKEEAGTKGCSEVMVADLVIVVKKFL